MIMLDKIPVKYRKYDSDKIVISKNIRFEKSVAEEINKIISFFNANEKVLRINNDFLINLAAKEFVENLDYSDLKEKVKREL